MEVKSTAGQTEGPPEAHPATAPRGDSDPGALALEVVPFEHYSLGEEHARGGLGRIVRAHDKRLDRQVAVKEILSGGQQAARRFVREARLTARLQHPSIVPVHEAGRWPTGEPFYTMKLVSGRSLKEVIDERKSLDERLALVPNVLAVAEAIAYAHSKRVIHRDLKPSNVLIGEFGETVVVDWGLAKDLADTSEDPEPSAGPYRTAVDNTLTVIGNVIGTPSYMPPEQAHGKPVDERADVYALGALLYHVLAGHSPYESGISADILDRVIAGPPPRLVERQPGVPRDLSIIVDKAMARRPEERYPSGRELAEDLRRFQTGQLITARQYSFISLILRWMRRHAAPVAVGLGALILLAGTGAVSVRRIVREKRIADEQRNLAAAQRAAAEQRADDLILTQARGWLDRDPTTALTWLKAYPPSGERPAVASDIARDAVARGVAHHVLRGHNGLIEGAGFSPDGKLFVTAGLDGRVNVWDVETGQVLAVLGEKVRASQMFSFSPDSKWLAISGGRDEITLTDLHGTTRALVGHEGTSGRTIFARTGHVLFSAGDDGTIRRWNLDDAEPKGEILAREPMIVGLASSPDGTTLAGFNREGLVAVWEVATGKMRVLPRGPGVSTGIDFSPDSKQLAIAGSDGTIKLWDFGSGALRSLTGHTDQVIGIDYSPDGQHLASGSKDRTVRIWDLQTGKATLLLGHQDIVMEVAYAPGGKLLASASNDRTVRVWEVASGYSRTLLGHTSGTRIVTFSRDGKTLASVGDEQIARLWRVPWSGDDVLRKGAHYVASAIFTPDGKTVMAAESNGALQAWTPATGAVKTLVGHTKSMTRLLALPDSKQVASVGWDGTLRLWDLETGTHKLLVQADEGIAWSVLLSPDQKSFATSDDRGVIRVIDRATGQVRELHGHKRGIYGLDYSPDGKYLASASVDRDVRLWDLATGQSQVIGSYDDEARAVAFSPDGKLVASVSHDGTARLTRLGGETRRLTGARGRLRALAFSPDGKWLATGGDDGILRLWDVATGEPRLFRGHSGTIQRIAFSPAGDLLASASDDSTVRLWDVASGESEILRGHQAGVLWVAFDPKGERLVSAASDGTTRLWTVVRPAPMAPLRAWLDAQTSEPPAEPGSP